MDLFDTKNILPMLFYPGELFDSKDYIYEIKFDGYRAIIYLEKSRITIKSRRNKDITHLYPELKDLNKASTKKCILDGELVVMDDNGPNFFKMQKRSLLSNKLKIEQEAINDPVCFVAFDILYYDKNDLRSMPLIKRKEYLKKFVQENNNLIISKYIEKEGIRLFKEVKRQNLEGIVAKEKNSLYQSGKRVHSWLKIKVFKEDDFYVIGFKKEDNQIKTIVVATKIKNDLILNGEVNLPNKIHQEYLETYSIKNIKQKAYFNIKNITWLNLKLKCTIRYKEKTSNNNLRHAIFIKFVD